MSGTRLKGLSLSGLAAIGLALALAAPAGAATKTFHGCVSGSAPLGDFSSNSLSLNLPVPKKGRRPQLGGVSAARVGARITHTSDLDLALVLVNPKGFAHSLAVKRGAGGDGYGSGAADCSGSPAFFEDSAATPISTPGNVPPAPVVGSFKPEQPLSLFNSAPAFGLWTLLVTDSFGGDTGAINAFSLDLTYTYKKLKKKGKKK